MSEVRTLEASFALSGTTQIASFSASAMLSSPSQVASFGASGHLNHVRSFSAEALITDTRGTFRGTMPTADRDALPALQPQDTVLNLDATTATSGTNIGQFQFWDGSAWMSAAQMVSPEAGKTALFSVPTISGWRVDEGDPTTPLRFWNGTLTRFSVDNTGLVYGRAVKIENTTVSNVALVVNQNPIGAVNLQEWQQGGSLESWVASNGAIETVSAVRQYQALGQAYAQIDIGSGAISMGPGGSVAPSFDIVWTATDVGSINTGDSLQWGGTDTGRLDSGGFVQLSAISAPSTPASNKVRLYDIGGVLKWKNSAGTVYDLSAFSTTTLATDTLWAATGDIVYGTGNDTAAILSANSSATSKYLRSVSSGAPAWVEPFGLYKSGAGLTTLADGDFSITPPNGAFGTAYNSTTGQSFFCSRSNGVWASVEVSTGSPGGGGASVISTDTLWDALGDLVYGLSGDSAGILSGNTTTTKKFLAQTGNGSASAAPSWFDLFGTANTFTAKQKFSAGAVAQSAALATSATSGDFYIPTSAGTPTGAPGSETGTVALRYDTTNNRLYVYNSAWLGVELA